MDAHTLAAALNGREYRNEITRDEAAQAKAAGLLVVYGASDDLTEFDGAICDEAGAYGSETHRITHSLEIYRERDDEEELVREGWSPPAILLTVRAEWCPDDLDCSWRITSSAPFASFDIMEDGELYCRGCVVDLTQLQSANTDLRRADGETATETDTTTPTVTGDGGEAG